MYEQNIYFPDAFKGCLNNCVYCKPSFQRQAKRQKQTCKVLNEKGIPKCYTFEPHIHKERIHKHLHDNYYAYRTTPKTEGKQFIFFPKGGDVCYASEDELEMLFDFIDNNSQTTFLMQTKKPEFLLNVYDFPKNLILGITLETDLEFFGVPMSQGGVNWSEYSLYSQISQATLPLARAVVFAKVKHPRKEVTIEPILYFSSVLVDLVKMIKPEFVYVGYDTKGCLLPEPSLGKTNKLIAELSAFTEVRQKTIREAWWHTPLVEVCEKELKEKK